MINSLRTKIARTSMFATSLVLISAIMVIFFTGFSRLNIIRDDNMKRALDYPLDRTASEFEQDFNDIVLVVYDKGHIATLYKGKAIDAHFMDVVLENVLQIANSPKQSGVVGLNFNYQKQVVDSDTVKIVFYNPSNSRSSFVPLAMYAIGVLIVGVMCHTIISTLLAQSAIHPIEENWKKQRQFVADASHELKTPLSVIMANTEIIASHPEDTVQSQMKWINNTLAESKRMASLVADLLFLAKSDDGALVQMQPTSVTDCVEECILTHEAVFYESSKTFQSEVAPDLWVNGNEGQLKQLVTILLDNANKYSVESGNIHLALEAVGKHVLLTVSNDSAELTEEQLAHLFDRFYVVDSSRNKNKGGNGLGLSIAERICQTHGGNISVNFKNGRTTFTVTLPLLKGKKNNK